MKSMALNRNAVTVVTGADSKFFLHVLLLQESFQHYCGGGVMVCDYGLSEAEKTFLDRRGLLLPAPMPLEPGRHAWYYKAALDRYLPRPGDGVIWLDADAVVTDDIVGRLTDFAADPARRRAVYACAENACSFAVIFDALTRAGKDEVTAFYRAAGVRETDTYVSSGVFLVCDPAVLATWRELVWSMPPHVLFEQNAFNLAARRFSLGVIDPTVFNVSQRELLTCVFRPEDRAVVTADGRRIAFLHMTANGEDVLAGENLAFPAGDGRVYQMPDYKLRRPYNPDVRLVQEAFLSRVFRKYGDELADLGIIRLDP